MEELETICSSGDLSLDALREKIKGIPLRNLWGSDFFHRACKNESFTMEMVEYIPSLFPDVANLCTYFDDYYMKGVYLIHMAC